MYSTKLEGKENTKLRIIWLHGWGADHKAMIPLATYFINQAENYLVDLPGFGQTKAPEKPCGSEWYADQVASFIESLPKKKTMIIGHSNGGRIAISLASKYNNLVDSIVLINGAGIPPKRGICFKFYSWSIKTFGPTLKKIFPFLKKISLSSTDYKNANGVMKEVFLNVIKEDLREKAKNITVPTLLIYGEIDRDTPVYMGEEYNKSIKGSILKIIQDAGHWGPLIEFRTKTHHIITNFIREKLC